MELIDTIVLQMVYLFVWLKPNFMMMSRMDMAELYSKMENILLDISK